MSNVQLIVGLGNPGKEYAETRHNAGEWFLKKLAAQYHQTLTLDKKYHGLYGRISIEGQDCHLLIPSTFMNLSGKSVRAIAMFYKIPIESILVVHDDLDLPPGTARLKQGGGDGGHNGLKDISAQLGKDYWRLRIGIGHPGDRDKVHDYVLSRPSRTHREQMDNSIDDALNALPEFVVGSTQKAIQQLHTASS